MCGSGCSPRASKSARKPPLIAAKDDIVHGAAQLPLDLLHIIKRRPGPGVTPLLADRSAQRRPRGRPQSGRQLREGSRRFCCLTDGSAWIVGHGTAQREGFADRQHNRVQSGLSGQREGGGLRAHGPVVDCGRRRFGREVEDHPVQVSAGDPVDHAVVHFGNQRPAIPGESFDDPVFPQRVIAVEPLGHDPRHQVARVADPLRAPAGRYAGRDNQDRSAGRQPRPVARGGTAPCEASGGSRERATNARPGTPETPHEMVADHRTPQSTRSPSTCAGPCPPRRRTGHPVASACP